MLKKHLSVLMAVLAVLTSFSGCVSTKSAELVPGTTYVFVERIYTNHWHNSWFTVIDGEFTIEEKSLRWVSSYGEEKTFPIEKWEWQELPFSEEEWKAFFDDPEDYFDLSPYGKIMFQPIDDFNFFLLANGDLWFVCLSFINTGSDYPLVLWRIDRLEPVK